MTVAREDSDVVLFEAVDVRARAVCRKALESAKVWPDDGPHKRFMHEQWQLGGRLRDESLPAVLGAEDAAALGASPVRMFGQGGRQLRVRLPYLLAIANELGRGLVSLVDRDAVDADATGRLCAVFNFSGALFDAMYDHYPRMYLRVAEAFNERVLRAVLGGHPGAAIELAQRADRAQRIEVRLLLKALGWSLARVRELGEKSGRLRELERAMVASLRAELVTIGGAQGSAAELREAARARFIAPFALIREVVFATCERHDRRALEVVDHLVPAIATEFWLLDDMADIGRDIRLGALNSVAAQAGAVPSRAPAVEANRVVAKQLMDSKILEGTAHELETTASRVAELLRTPSLPKAAAGRLSAALASYARNSF